MLVHQDEYMFREHSPQELVGWTERLQFFRYHRALGGMANDGDTLRAAIPIGENDAAAMLAQVEPLLPDHVHAHASGGVIWIEMFGTTANPYVITEADIVFAQALERRLAELPFRFQVPPSTDDRCFSEETYQQYFLKTIHKHPRLLE